MDSSAKRVSQSALSQEIWATASPEMTLPSLLPLKFHDQVSVASRVASTMGLWEMWFLQEVCAVAATSLADLVGEQPWPAKDSQAAAGAYASICVCGERLVLEAVVCLLSATSSRA